jgi:hypothetical protein
MMRFAKSPQSQDCRSSQTNAECMAVPFVPVLLGLCPFSNVRNLDQRTCTMSSPNNSRNWR